MDFAEMNRSAFLNQNFADTVKNYLIFCVLVDIRVPGTWWLVCRLLTTLLTVVY